MGIISRLLGKMDDSNSVRTNIGRIRDEDFQGLIKNPDYDVKLIDGQIVVEHHPERGIGRAWFNNLSTKMKNNVGRMKSYGECNRCGGTWNWKKGHSLKMTDNSECFPLCEECWHDSTKEEKLKYYLGHLYKHPDREINFEEADKRLREQIEEYHSSARRVN